MENEIFFVSKTGQIATAIVLFIVFSFFVFNMSKFNNIETINVFKDIRTKESNGKYAVVNSNITN